MDFIFEKENGKIDCKTVCNKEKIKIRDSIKYLEFIYKIKGLTGLSC